MVKCDIETRYIEEDIIKELCLKLDIRIPVVITDNIFGVSGAYNKNGIYLNPRSKDIGYTLCHEYGHHLYSKEVTSETHTDRDWLEAYFDSRNDFPTKYSEENIYECFSECFAHYCLGLRIAKGFKDYFDKYFKEFDTIIKNEKA